MHGMSLSIMARGPCFNSPLKMPSECMYVSSLIFWKSEDKNKTKQNHDHSENLTRYVKGTHHFLLSKSLMVLKSHTSKTRKYRPRMEKQEFGDNRINFVAMMNLVYLGWCQQAAAEAF